MTALKNWMHARLLRLYYWIQLSAAREAVKVARLSCSLLDAEIRALKPELPQLGEDEELDLVVEYVARHLSRRDLLPQLQPVLADPRAPELIELARNSEAVKQVLARYHAVEAFFASMLKDAVRKEMQQEFARLAIPGTPEYDAATVYREHSKTRVRLKSLQKELAERSAFKVELSVTAISGGVALLSALFLVAGFLYVHYFFGRMGVDVSLYFSVGDYLAASVEQIRSGAFAASVALGTFALGIRAGSLRSKLHARAAAPARRREGWAIALLSAALLLTTAYSLYVGKPFYSGLRMSGIVLSYWAADYVAAAFFTNRIAAMTAIAGTLVFASDVAVSAYERSERLLIGPIAKEFRQEILFKDASPPVQGELFGANSSFYFIYSRATQVTHVVPRDRVAQIDIQRVPF